MNIKCQFDTSPSEKCRVRAWAPTLSELYYRHAWDKFMKKNMRFMVLNNITMPGELVRLNPRILQ